MALAAAIGATCAAFSLPPSMARADLPALICSDSRPISSCMSYENNFVTVALVNRDSASFWYTSEVRLELVYYRSKNDGAEVLRRTGTILEMWPYPFGVAKTEPLWTINAGYYCPRTYWLNTGYWHDEFCYSDTGVYWKGKDGYGRPGQ